MLFDCAIWLAISLNIIGIVSMIFDNLVRTTNLVGEFTDFIILGRTLDLDVNFDYSADLEGW